jgi:hypothetical protein
LEQHEKIGKKKKKKNTDHMSLRISPEIKMKKNKGTKSCTSCIQLRFLTLQEKEEEEEKKILHEFCCKNQFSIPCQEKNKFGTSDGISQQIQTIVVHLIR